MTRRIWFIFMTLVVALAAATAVAIAFDEPTSVSQPVHTQTPDTAVSPTTNNPLKQALRDLPQPDTYIITLADAPLASYNGGVTGMAATNPKATGADRLDMASAAATSYRAYLMAKQNNLVRAMSSTYGRSVDAFYHYTVALNGVAVQLSEKEAEIANNMPGVTAVTRDQWYFPTTDATPTFIGATALWDGTATGGIPGTKGDGVIVGVIDTGIWPEHPSFADNGSYPAPPAYWGGICQPPSDGQNYLVCNHKLIGAQHFLAAYVLAVGEYNGDFYSARDDNGHGTHTASTTAGNQGVNATMLGVPRGTVSGIAPRAYVAAYKALGPWGGLSSDLLSAIDKAVADGVDVINYSIGGPSNDPWQDVTALAFMNAREAGVFAAVSAGNSGPGPSTLGSPGDAPWVTTVGASNSNRHFLSDIVVTPSLTMPIQLYGSTLTSGVTNFELVDAANYIDSTGVNGRLCLNPFSPGTFNNHQVVLCERGVNARVAKGDNVKAGGAGGLILANAEQGDLGTDHFTLPAVHVNADVGAALRSHIAANSPVTISFTSSQAVYAPDSRVPVDEMAGFSSRGPVLQGNSNYVKPNVTGPGVQILAGQTAFADGQATGELFQAIAGTSMSSPHVAGAGALLVALHPDWTPAEIESALMTTANDTHLKEDGLTPADAFDMGAGRIDLFVASKAGLVLNEVRANYLAANPDGGGDPSTLNIASLANGQCLAECSWQRTVRSTLAYTVTWTAVTTQINGLNLTITPAQFVLGPGSTQTVTVTANVEGFEPDGGWHFVGFTLQPDTTQVPDAHFPIALLPTNSLMADKVTDDTTSKSGSVSVNVVSRQITDLSLTPKGLAVGTVLTTTLVEDPTPDNPYDNLNDGTTHVITVTVPAGATRLVAETIESTATDVDLFVGTGEQPSSATQVCSSTTPYPIEYCNINTPAEGVWWILVQNWREGAAAPDLVKLVFAVTANDTGEVTASGPTGLIPAGQPFDVSVNWQQAQIAPGDRAYGSVTLGADAAHPDNVGIINLNVIYRGAAAMQLSDTAVSVTQAPNSTQTHTLTIANPGDIDLVWTVTRETAVSRITLDIANEEPAANPASFTAWGDFSLFQWLPRPEAALPTPSTPSQMTGGQVISLVLDDGAPEENFGAYGRQFIWLNRFTPRSTDFPFSLTEVQVLFDNSAFSGVNVGELVDIYVYEDADGNPNTGAHHVGTIKNAAVQAADGTTFSTYTFDQPIQLTEPGDVLIAVVNRTAAIGSSGYPAALDTSTSKARSWIGMYQAGAPSDPPTIPADTSWGLLDSLGAPGNWLIRGVGEKCGAQEIPWLTVTPPQGTTPAGGSSDLQLQINTSGLTYGSHTAVLCFDSNASGLTDVFVRVPVTVDVQDIVYKTFLPRITQ
ncbi:MAG: S8 family serine peptidase [Chloroflexi bacterium]|nr:S8 family serine peptidase [Chloroflexota bacterium]